MSRRALRRALAMIALAGIAGCSAGGPAGTATPARSATPSATTAPTPTPPPDTMSVSILATGVSTYALATIPVAVLHNDAIAHAAAGVVVHFVTHRAGGGRLGAVDSAAVLRDPGETLAVSADCTDLCNNAVATDASLVVGD